MYGIPISIERKYIIFRNLRNLRHSLMIFTLNKIVAQKRFTYC